MTVASSIPPRPSSFDPSGAPPGVAVDLEAYRSFVGNGPWYLERPIIKPRLIVVHTNAAGGEASTHSKVRWANGGTNRTHAHYNVNEPMPTKHAPTDRRSIANATPTVVEERYGVSDVSFWSISVETADMGSVRAANAGYRWPYDCGPFLYDHAEKLARILAYESVVWDIPLEAPDVWSGSGVVAHTYPFGYTDDGYGYYTITRGKTCPGESKIGQLYGEVLPRARQIRDGWLNPVPERPPPLPTSGSGVASPPGFPPFYPDTGHWSLWPLNPNKPVLRRGDRGDAVRYLEGVLRLKAGQNIAIDGWFGAKTEEAVRNLQRFFGLTVDGEVGRMETWPVVDFLAGLP